MARQSSEIFIYQLCAREHDGRSLIGRFLMVGFGPFFLAAFFLAGTFFLAGAAFLAGGFFLLCVATSTVVLECARTLPTNTKIRCTRTNHTWQSSRPDPGHDYDYELKHHA